MTLAEFRRVYPTAAFAVSGGKPFTYRYYQNPQAKATLVLLTGGIGLSDLFYKHFARFARDFSVLTFDYQLPFENNAQFADAVAELLESLEESEMDEFLSELISPSMMTMYVTPKDIDETVKRLSFTISEGLNLAFS